MGCPTLLQQLASRLRQSLRRHDLLPRDHRILVALSGGQDSLALGECLHYLHNQCRWPSISLAYCDHRWPHDEGNAQLVSKYAESRHLPLHIIDAADSSTNIAFSENAAREWRYASLAQLAQRLRFHDVVTAHTSTDLAETVLFNLSHGSGGDGLSSLTWKRRLSDGVNLVRPFLSVSRDETLRLCKEQDLKYWQDHYNQDMRFARNRIRRTVMPVLRQCVNEKVEEALARTAHILRDDNMYLEEQAAIVWSRTVSIDFDSKSSAEDRHVQRVTIDRSVLSECSIAIQRRVIRRVLRDFVGMTYRSAGFQHIEAICSLVTAETGSSPASLPGDARAVVVDDRNIVIEITDKRKNTELISNAA